MSIRNRFRRHRLDHCRSVITSDCDISANADLIIKKIDEKEIKIELKEPIDNKEIVTSHINLVNLHKELTFFGDYKISAIWHKPDVEKSKSYDFVVHIDNTDHMIGVLVSAHYNPEKFSAQIIRLLQKSRVAFKDYERTDGGKTHIFFESKKELDDFIKNFVDYLNKGKKIFA